MAEPAAAHVPTAEEVHLGAKVPRARNALHMALTANDSKEAARLIENGDDALLTQQSIHGCTPLMLLAMGHCDEALLWRLLERRAAVEASAALRSETRRTAADYAAERESHRGEEVVAALRALELAERRRSAACRCPECGDVVRKRPLLRYFWERAEKGEEDNALLRRFFEQDCFRALLDPRYHQINEVRQVRKELSESVAMLEALQLLVPELDATWHVIDLCCGKSLTGGLAALRLPGLAVTAVDRVEPRFVPHFPGPEGGGGTRYLQLDVLGDSFQDELQRHVTMLGRPAVLLGMHLCGALSLRAIEAFASLEAAVAVALAPCCLPGKGDAEAPAALFASRDGAVQYQAWAEHLEASLRAAAPGAVVRRAPVPEILSPKNEVICARKGART